MLRYLRENTGNWIIKFFLGIIVIVFVFLGVGSMKAGKHNQVATVNDQAITFTEYRDAYQRIIQRLQQQFGTALDDDLIKALNVKQHAVNSLIDQKILELEAEKLNIIVSDEELKQDLLSVKAFQRDGVFDMDLYKRVLGQNAMTPETFEAMQRNTIRNTKLQLMVINSITVGNQEAQAWYAFNNITVGINYILIDPGTFSDVFAGAEQIRAQYDAHHDLYMSEPKRKVAFLVFSPGDFEDQVKIEETAIREFYDQNLARFTETDKTPETVTPFETAKAQIQKELAASQVQDLAYNKAEDAYDAVLDGDSFEQVALVAAKQPVTTPAFTARGTELKGMGISDPGEFASAAFSLVDSEISEVKKIGNNYYLMHVLEKIEPKLLAYDDVKNKIAVTLTAGLQKQAAQKAAESMLEKAGNDAPNLEKLAEDNHLKVESSKMFTRNDAVPGIAGSAAIAQAAFTLDDKNPVYKQVLEASGKFYIIGLKEKQVPDAAAIADNLDKVKQQLKAQKQQVYYSQWLSALKDKAKIGINTDIIN